MYSSIRQGLSAKISERANADQALAFFVSRKGGGRPLWRQLGAFPGTGRARGAGSDGFCHFLCGIQILCGIQSIKAEILGYTEGKSAF